MNDNNRFLRLAEAIEQIAVDAGADAKQARRDGDPERAQYLLGERRGLLEAAEIVRHQAGVDGV